MDQFFIRAAAKISAAIGQPFAFMAFIIIWAATGPFFGFSETWQLIVNTTTTIITFLMVFMIQHAQNRDAAAMQAKLDELIRALEPARNDYIGIEHLTETELELIRAADVVAPTGGGEPHHTDSLGQLIRRR